MILYLRLKNFKSFSDITLDLRKTENKPKQLVFLYGENGSGKSNLISAFQFLKETSQTFTTHNGLLALKEKSVSSDNEDFVHDREDFIKELMLQIIPSNIVLAYDRYKMLGSESPMSIEIGFRIHGKNGVYYLELDDKGVKKEQLNYLVNVRTGTLFSIDRSGAKLNFEAFLDQKFRAEMTTQIEKFWGRHSFLALLTYELESKNKRYIKSVMSESVLNVLEWLNSCKVMIDEKDPAIPRMFDEYLSSELKFEKGVVSDIEDTNLKAYRVAIKNLLTVLYSDIQDVVYEFNKRGSQYHYKLSVVKLIDGQLLTIPFELESSGTKRLLGILPYIIHAAKGYTVFVDEIDSGIHDLLMSDIIESLEESLKGQFIATTHNTLLLENIKPDNVYVIRVDANGFKSIDCVAEYGKRTQQNNNMRKKYLEGDYEGIPNTAYLDIDDVLYDMSKAYDLSANVVSEDEVDYET